MTNTDDFYSDNYPLPNFNKLQKPHTILFSEDPDGRISKLMDSVGVIEYKQGETPEILKEIYKLLSKNPTTVAYQAPSLLISGRSPAKEIETLVFSSQDQDMMLLHKLFQMTRSRILKD